MSVLIGTFGQTITTDELMVHEPWDGYPDKPVLTQQYWSMGYNVFQGNISNGLSRFVATFKDFKSANAAAKLLEEKRKALNFEAVP